MPVLSQIKETVCRYFKTLGTLRTIRILYVWIEYFQTTYVTSSPVISIAINVSDIDVMPNTRLRHQFAEFAERRNLFDQSVSDTSAYVLPVFEVLEGLPFPEEKGELLSGVSVVNIHGDNIDIYGYSGKKIEKIGQLLSVSN